MRSRDETGRPVSADHRRRYHRARMANGEAPWLC